MEKRSSYRTPPFFHTHIQILMRYSKGFTAKPQLNVKDGSLDLYTWKCGIPGKEGTEWEGGVYQLTLKFYESKEQYKFGECHREGRMY